MLKITIMVKKIYFIYTDNPNNQSEIWINSIFETYPTIKPQTLDIIYNSNVNYVQTPKIKVIRSDKLTNVDIDNFNMIRIYDGQYYDNLYQVVYDWVFNKNKHVIISSVLEFKHNLAINYANQIRKFNDLYISYPFLVNIHNNCDRSIDNIQPIIEKEHQHTQIIIILSLIFLWYLLLYSYST